MMYNKKNIFFLVALLNVLSACNTMPISGPQNNEIKTDADRHITPKSSTDNNQDVSYKNGYVLVDVNEYLVSKMNSSVFKKEYVWPAKGASQEVKISMGDALAVSIYESSSGGLFIPIEAGIRPGNFVTLPNQFVDSQGCIYVPYAGKIKVVGLTAIEISNIIEKKLKNIAIEPQIVVNIVARNSYEINVLGSVSRPSRYALNFGGERILDAISRSGGPENNGFDMSVSLQRSDQEYVIPFKEIIEDSEKNIYLQANDTVYIERDPETFSMFGAGNFSNRYDFSKRNLYLAEAIGIFGGLNDDRADPEEVFLYRQEGCTFVQELNRDVDVTGLCHPKTHLTSVIYNLNLRAPNGYILAQHFKMRDDDVIYVGNSRASEFVKLLGIINTNSVTTINTRNAKD